MARQIRLVALDMDGTLTQHKSPISRENKAVLDALGEKYRLLMVGAGQCQRIYRQLGEYPIDIIGNYGMQACEYDPATRALRSLWDERVPCDRVQTEARVTELRERFGYTRFTGDNVEYHASGCITFPLLGTEAPLADKLVFDPHRHKRRAIYGNVVAAFPEYHVFVGGSSSFDMAPRPFDKRFALQRYCAGHGFDTDEVVYIGDDYGTGGNDEAVYRSSFRFLTIDDYRDFPAVVAPLLQGGVSL